MAEFQEVMEQYHRMCQSYKDCEGCPMYMQGFCTDLMSVDIRSTEQVIMNWAEEHPEPVYPLWFEWLEQIGVAGRAYELEPYFAGDKEIYMKTAAFTPKAFKPIPADIAQKLGIKPKEDT